MEKLNKFLKSNIFKWLLIVVNFFITFTSLDIGIRYVKPDFYEVNTISSLLFTLSYVCLFLGIYLLLSQKKNFIYLALLVIIFNVITYSEYLHLKMLQRFYTFGDLFLASEGSKYFTYAIGKTDIQILLIMLISFVSCLVIVFIGRRLKKTPRKNWKYYALVVLVTILFSSSFRALAISNLGNKAADNAWDSASNLKNVYLNFSDSNKSFKVSGLYEFTFRSIYLYYTDLFTTNKDDLKTELTNYFNTQNQEPTPNEYTGIFEANNVIVILMESIDSWLITEDVMPTLFQLKNEGLNFQNRYSPFFGGAQTINSEFALNTGLYAPNKGKGIFNYNNKYSTSLANKFKENGYSANSVHANTGSYYNRLTFHHNLGYDQHYALLDNSSIEGTNQTYFYDSNLILNDQVYNWIVRDDKFLSFITTYSAHLPYVESNDLCTAGNKVYDNTSTYENFCIKNMAGETDRMLKYLIERLEADNKLDNTVLVLVTDHYTYSYPDTEYLYNVKGTNNKYLLQNTPFIIWKKDIEHQDIKTIVDTADILPTLFNLFGIAYNPNYYNGTDIFSTNHENYVYFADDTYYDQEGLHLLTKSDTTQEEQKIFNEIQNRIDINDKIIYSNYFNTD